MVVALDTSYDFVLSPVASNRFTVILLHIPTTLIILIVVEVIIPNVGVLVILGKFVKKISGNATLNPSPLYNTIL